MSSFHFSKMRLASPVYYLLFELLLYYFAAVMFARAYKLQKEFASQSTISMNEHVREKEGRIT